LTEKTAPSRFRGMGSWPEEVEINPAIFGAASANRTLIVTLRGQHRPMPQLFDPEPFARFWMDPGVFVSIGGGSITYPADEATMRAHVAEADVREREELARRFAERAASLGVDELYAVFEPELVLTAIVAKRELELELELRAALIALASQMRDPGIGELRVRTRDRHQLELSELGTRLI
jgi:hypothetical protein